MHIIKAMSSVPKWRQRFLTWLQEEFDLMIHSRHPDLHLGAFKPADGAQLSVWVMAIAGAFTLIHLPFRVLAQVLHDLIATGHKQMASWLYSATLTTVTVAGRREHKAVMCQVCSALQRPELIVFSVFGLAVCLEFGLAVKRWL